MGQLPTNAGLPNLDAVDRLGSAIAQKLRVGDVVALSGTLGAGKTTLARAILRHLGHEGDVPSPSFTILEVYEPPAVRLPLVHADFYRLDDPSEAEQLGLEEYRADAAMIAEWPENAGGFAHDERCLQIDLSLVGERRIAKIEPGKDWLKR